MTRCSNGLLPWCGHHAPTPAHSSSIALTRRVQLMSEPARVEYTFEVEKAHPATVTLHHAEGGSAIVVNPTARAVRISINEVSTTEPGQSCPRESGAALVRESPLSVADDTWFKSSYSDAGQSECVEAALRPGGIAVRDSQEPDRAVLAFSTSAWRDFVTTIRRDEEGRV
ncbi:hypothetical protein SMALA_4169 [Streptomyces malaysiensis subsp. malaysiensis]|nr:hypothetical protein SMALA_4169 [Streptomyces malaysiensis]